MSKQLIFSDMDGTLVHGRPSASRYGDLSEDGRSFTVEGVSFVIRPLPPSSSTGSQSYISERTLQLVADLRRAGHLFVHITAARSSSFMERLAWLPAADAYIFECGGRIFLRSDDDTAATAAPMVEDLEWRRQHEASPMFLESIAPSDRPGLLWKFCAQLQKDGWTCDTRSYYTCFRINIKKSNDKTDADLEKLIASLPQQLKCSFNLGFLDIFPSSSGKEKAAEYLMKKWGFSDAISLGDDDNDIALAQIMSHTYMVGFTHDSVRKAVEANPSKFTVAMQGAFLGIHEVLETIKQKLNIS
eukprot:Skav218719  [mRNA]  locus=scaffold1346:715488:716390:+ [translate_table: standard]